VGGHQINAFCDSSHKKETPAAEALARRRGTTLRAYRATWRKAGNLFQTYSDGLTKATGSASNWMRTVLDFLREGDLLMVTRIDRRARSIGDLQDIVRAVRARGGIIEGERAAD